jgi:hypothetical protein
MQPPYNYPNPGANHFGQIPPPVFPQKPHLPWKPRLLALGLSLLLYALACALPVLDFLKEDGSPTPESPMLGFVLLFIGWLGILIGQFAWLANLGWLLSMILLLLRRWVASLVTTVLTMLVALHTFALFTQRVPANEAATDYLRLQQVKIGFYVWLVSFLVIGISALILRSRERALLHSTQFQQYPQAPHPHL